MKMSSPPLPLKHERAEPLKVTRKVALKSFSVVKGKVVNARSAEATLPFGQKVGPLKIGHNRPLGRERKFYAQCECGTGRWYTASTLHLMIDDRLGCGEPDCCVISLKEKLWRDKEESLRLQLFLLLVTQPDEVQSVWGGSLDDLTPVRSFEEGYDNLTSYLKGGGQWFKRHDEELPFIEGNVSLSYTPDGLLSKVASGTVLIEGVPMSFRELCHKTGLRATDLLLKLYKLRDCEDLLLTIMEGK